jgi:hypothetical protein
MATHTEAKPHISHTQLEMYARCGEQYRRRYVEGERLPPGIALLVGGATHVGIETNFRQKVDTHTDLPAKEIIEASAAAFHLRVAGGYELSEKEADRGAKVVLGEAVDQTVALAGLHATEQAPDYQPVQVERQTRIRFPAATHDLLAVTDLRDDRRRVTDFKTAGQRKPEAEVHKSLQLTIYAAAYHVDRMELPDQVRLDVLVKNRTPVRELLISQRNEADFQALVNRVNATLAAINAGVFPPCSPGDWVCSPKWCGYWSSCVFVNSERREAAGG